MVEYIFMYAHVQDSSVSCVYTKLKNWKEALIPGCKDEREIGVNNQQQLRYTPLTSSMHCNRTWRNNKTTYRVYCIKKQMKSPGNSFIKICNM